MYKNIRHDKLLREELEGKREEGSESFLFFSFF